MLHSLGRHPPLKGVVKLLLVLSAVLVSCSPFGASPSRTVTPTTHSPSITSPSTVSSIHSLIDCPQPQAAPGKVSLDGLGYGPYHTGQNPNYSISPSQEETAADMPTLASLTHNIRIYSSLGPANDIVHEADAMHMCVNLGIWLGKSSGANPVFSYPKNVSGQAKGMLCPAVNNEDINAKENNDDNDRVNNREIMAGIRLVSNLAVHSITVGNEVLLRGDLTEDQLAFILDQVHAHLSRPVPITLADDYSQWLCHPDLARRVDFITIHIYPFWNGVSIDDAIKFLDMKYQLVQNKFPGKLIVLGETGWPSSGPPQGAAAPSPANQTRYFTEFMAWAQLHRVQYYYFDAFDENWKTNESGVGTHWGLYQRDGQVKPTLKDMLPLADSATLKQRTYRDVYTGSALEEGFGLGIDTSEKERQWLTAEDGVLTLNYPVGQLWGTMFITTGPPVPPGRRPSIDLHTYHSLLLDIRSMSGNQCIRLGIKDRTQPDDGSEITLPMCLARPPCAEVRALSYDGKEITAPRCLAPQWSTIALPLNTFANVDLTHMYVVFEIVFLGNASAEVELRDIRYSPAQVPPLPIPSPPVPFNVYTDLGDIGNHYVPTGGMGDFNAISMTQSWTNNPHSGATCIQVVYNGVATQGNGWAGVYWQDPVNNWGKTPGPTGYNLSHFSKLSFWVRGKSGGERIQFLMGGITGAYPDSLQPAVKTPVITLTTNWQLVTISLEGYDLTHIIGGFGWVANNTNNPDGATFYLDDIVYSV